MSFVGTEVFCNELKQLLLLYARVNSGIVRASYKYSTGIVILKTGGNNQIIKFFEWLYKDATIYLERKYNKFLEIKEIKQRYSKLEGTK